MAFHAPTRRTPTVPQPEHPTGGVSVTGTNPNGPSPADIFRAAVEAGPLTPAERTAFRSQLAHVAAQDEQRRSEPSPQGDLELAA